ncbi:acyl carrier protein [Streptomyces sp. NPDC057638]|uniref:acyl carrier protein n=1 Tax=Streptomyces sp. NPDC057638 TaxID=3346190 RepID=UPI00369FAEE2
MTTPTEEILDFLAQAIGKRVDPEEDYFASGLADSLFALELVTYVERRFDLAIEVEDLELDNFRTASRVAAFVHAKTASPGTEAARERG